MHAEHQHGVPPRRLVSELLTGPRSTRLRRMRLCLAVTLALGAIGCGASPVGNSDPAPDVEGGSDLGGSNDAGAPTLTELVAGDGQSAAVGTPVDVVPRMRVTDSDGIPVPDVEVTFSVLEGHGVVEGPMSLTDADGLAAPERWLLGPTPGLNRLMGEVPGLAPIFFEATGRADARGSFVIDAGNFQNARIGTAVEVPPRVRFTTEDGVPVPDRPVSFEIGSGGGMVRGQTSVTDDDGTASVDEWVMGPEPGPQTLIARTEGLPPVAFEAMAVDDRAPVLSEETWLDELRRPWDLAFLPDGSMLMTERGGRILIADPSSRQTRVLVNRPEDFVARGQSGLLGLAVDPDFQNNRYVYTFLASDRDGDTDNRIRRWRLSESNEDLVEDQDILTGMTYAANGAHSGGRIRFGPEGYLYITTGDTRSATVPQDLQELGGKILRITRDGEPAPGNPQIPGALPEIFFVGVRNPQGIAFRPGTGDVFICEHGPDQDDEITRLVAGGNGGWNPNDGEGNYNGYDGALMSDPSISDVVLPTYRVPNSAGMSGCDFMVGAEWRAWDQALLVGMLAGTRALVVSLDSAGTSTTEEPTTVLDTQARIRSIVMGPDGYMYVAIDSEDGEIWRVTPN